MGLLWRQLRFLIDGGYLEGEVCDVASCSSYISVHIFLFLLIIIPFLLVILKF